MSAGFSRIKLRWARKLLGARMFVVMTEKESAIAIDGADPRSFTDALALAAQEAELELFRDKLDGLIAAHQMKLRELGGGADEPTTASRKTKGSSTAKNASKRTTQVHKNAYKKAKD